MGQEKLVFYVCSDGKNPRKSVIYTSEDVALEVAKNNPRFMYMYKNVDGNMSIIWERGKGVPEHLKSRLEEEVESEFSFPSDNELFWTMRDCSKAGECPSNLRELKSAIEKANLNDVNLYVNNGDIKVLPKEKLRNKFAVSPEQFREGKTFNKTQLLQLQKEYNADEIVYFISDGIYGGEYSFIVSDEDIAKEITKKYKQDGYAVYDDNGDFIEVRDGEGTKYIAEVYSNKSMNESFAQVTFKPFNSESDINKYKHTNGYNIEQVAKRLNLKAKVHAYTTGDNQLENMRMSVEGERSQIEKLIDFCKTILHLEVEGKPRFLSEKLNRELKEDIEGDIEELVLKITKQAKLTREEREMLLHDINNLRGDEWLEVVEDYCSKKTIKEFKEIINYDDEGEEDIEEDIEGDVEGDVAVYNLEVGVLLNKSHRDYDGYTSVYDKKHSYYDESYMNGFNFEALKSKGLSYIAAGVKNTYAVITKIVLNKFWFGDSWEDIEEEIKENGFIEESVAVLDGEQYKAENVVFSAFKNSDGEIVENFINIANNTLKESTLKVNTNKPLKELNWKYAIVKYDQNGKKRTVQIFKTEDEAIRGKENLKEIPGVEYSIEKIFEEAVKVKR